MRTPLIPASLALALVAAAAPAASGPDRGAAAWRGHEPT